LVHDSKLHWVWPECMVGVTKRRTFQYSLVATKSENLLWIKANQLDLGTIRDCHILQLSSSRMKTLVLMTDGLLTPKEVYTPID
jgi:hypothetical protein